MEFGYGYINDSPTIRERRLTYGSFSPAFLAENLYIATLMPPETLNLGCLVDPDCALVTPSLWGMGLVWVSPLLLAGVLEQRQRTFTALALGTALIMLPSLLYHNTGSAQFGYRFLMDAMPLWMLAVAAAVQRWPARLLLTAVGYSLLVNLVGTLWLMGRLIPATP